MGLALVTWGRGANAAEASPIRGIERGGVDAALLDAARFWQTRAFPVLVGLLLPGRLFKTPASG